MQTRLERIANLNRMNFISKEIKFTHQAGFEYEEWCFIVSSAELPAGNNKITGRQLQTKLRRLTA